MQDKKTVKDLTENKHVPRIGKDNNVLCVFEKNQKNELDEAGEHSHCILRCQKRVPPTYKK